MSTPATSPIARLTPPAGVGGSLRALAGRAVIVLSGLVALYFVAALYASGKVWQGSMLLAVLGLLAWIYTSERLYAWRYLFPGVAAAVAFVLFPLVYTVAIGFTNYSSRNLLSFERATAYLLTETYRAPGPGYGFTLHREGPAYRIRLEQGEGGPSWGAAFVSAALALRQPGTPEVALTPLERAPVALGEAVPLRDLIALQPMLRELTLSLPDGAKVRMAGLREFAPVAPLYQREGGTGLRNMQTGALLKPDFDTGFYRDEQGQSVQPGFKVNIGFANFAQIFQRPEFREPFVQIFLWTVAFSGLTVLFALTVGVVLAVLLSWEALRFRGVYRTLLFLPYAVPAFISILVFKGLFNDNFGEINLILDVLFGLRPAWFSDPLLAKVMILLVNTWLGYPYMMVLCMGLIKAIPSDLYEAAAIAGVGPLTCFFRITLPLIMRPLTPLLIAAFAFNFNNFVLISLLTGGRPDFLDTRVPAGTNDLLVSYTYRIAFEDSGQNFGLAAAISTIIFAMVAVLSIINLRLTRGREGRRARRVSAT